MKIIVKDYMTSVVDKSKTAFLNESGFNLMK